MKSAVLVSLGWCVAALALQLLRVLALGVHHAQAPARASAWRGVAWALGPGMLPWRKDGARRHPAMVVAGVVYHLAVGVALAFLALRLADGTVSRVWAAAAAVVLAAGACAGIGLLVRRARSPMLRRISAPDDYASNLIADLFLASAAVAAVRPALTTAFLAVATVLFAYAPLGKIRHCVYLPVARVIFGAQLGRRGVLADASHGGCA